MKRHICLLLSLIISICCSYSCQKVVTAKQNNKFVFVEKIPSFSEEYDQFLQRNYCKIFSEISKPYAYYIKELNVTNEGFIVQLYPLAVLQTGANSNKTQMVFAYGEVWFIYFNKKEEYIKTEER